MWGIGAGVGSFVGTDVKPLRGANHHLPRNEFPGTA